MKYAVIYYSETGKTKFLADRIYATINSGNKIMVNLKDNTDIPKADFALTVWLPDDVEYLGMFLCQGRTAKAQKEAFYKSNPEYKDKMQEMFEEGDYHPSSVDFDNAANFVMNIITYNS